ncbi:MAG: protein kinase [Nannocystaceae bacterium]
MPSLTGQRVDKYDMLEEVGCGGMAVVYRSRDSVLDREVAVKVLHAHLADREESRLRLRREALTVAKLRHDNILEIFDYSGPDADESYIVTEFIHGPTLAEWLGGDAFQPRPVLAALIVHHLCLALAHAHDEGVVHRDLKPENVMIREQDGCIKLMDFGIAQILDQQKLTLTGQLLGSPAYMAPELINGQPIDARTDLFSISVLLYQIATGTLPFSGRNPHEVLNRIADAEYVAPSAICALVDEDLEAIIARGLARDPDDRYQSARSLAADLNEYARQMGVSPGDNELRSYFAEPHAYVEAIDHRACVALLEAARQAMQAGNTARTLRLLGRILELDPGNTAAEALLATVRQRGRRMRQLLLAGAVTAFAGFVSAGVMLMGPESTEEGLEARDPGATKPTAEGVVEIESSDPPIPVRTRTADSGHPTAPPVGTRAKRPETEFAKNSVRRASARRTARRSLGDRTTACKIRVDNLPVAQRRLYTLQGGDQSVRLKRSDAAEIQVPTAGLKVSLRDGPRYDGTKFIYPRDCEGGKLITLIAKPKPARVVFTDYPDEFVISCNKGCKGQYTPDNFPSLRIPLDSDRLELELTLRARGHRHRKETRSLQPGKNTWRANLKPGE